MCEVIVHVFFISWNDRSLYHIVDEEVAELFNLEPLLNHSKVVRGPFTEAHVDDLLCSSFNTFVKEAS